MSENIRLENIIKIYGPTPRQRPLKMLQEGASKEAILQKTGHVVGVNNVSFEVQEGEIFVVMGLSGSGKSTLIRCVNRLVEPTYGKIFVGEQNIAELDKEQLREVRRNKMAMVFQHFGLFPHRSVIDNVGYGLAVRRKDEEEIRERSMEALDMVGLKAWADYMPNNLSGGMQQRVGLARALATDANILLMDEAFSALDPLIRREMQDELLNLQEKLQKTILFITHDLGEALRVGNRVAMMNEGEVVQIGSPQEIITEPANDYVAEFMADVDSGRVLTAEFIASPSHALRADQHDVDEALRRMDKHSMTHIYVIDGEGYVEGLLSHETATKSKEQGKRKFNDMLRSRHLSTSPNARLNELYDMSTKGEPIAVLGDDGRLRGVVNPLDIFNALSVTLDTESTEDGYGTSSNGSSSQNGSSYRHGSSGNQQAETKTETETQVAD